jgi:protocatechuate 3,4-dioxygenase beta subunit
LAVLAGSLQAQTPPPAAPVTSIEGVVTDAVTGLPLRDIVVVANRYGVPDAKTDAQGHYIFPNLTGGFYQIWTRPEGYVNRSAFVRVLPGHQEQSIDFKLERAAVLAGRVLDRDKNPVPRARVSLRTQGYRDGRPALGSFRSAAANDSGEFRIAGINPGSYILEVEPRLLAVRKLQPGEPRVEREPVIADVRTYYNGSSGLDGARQLTFTAGQQLEGLDIVLLRTRTVCLGGSVDGAPGQRFGLMLAESMPSGQSRVAMDAIAAGEEFEVCGLPSGAYRLSVSTPRDLRYATEAVTLTDRAVRAPKLMPVPPLHLKGTVTVEGARPDAPPPGGLHISLDPKDRIAMEGETTSVAVDPSGAFLLSSVLLDEYWLRVQGLPAGYYVKQATVNGHDVLRDPLRTGEGDVSIVLSAEGSAVSGSVNTTDRQPVANTVVFLAVAPLPQTIGWGDIRTAFTDQNGFFSFPSLPPGEYRLMASPQLTDDALVNPELVRSNLPSAVALTVRAGEMKTTMVTVAAK